MDKLSQQQGTDHHNSKKAASQDQLRASTPEAMAKIVTHVNPHQSYSEFFQNIHDGDDFTMDVVTMGGPVERPIEIHTSSLVLDFSLTHAPLAASLQYSMAIILKRSQDKSLSAPVEWDTFIKQGKAEVMIEEAMVEFSVDTNLEVRRKKRLDDEVSLVAPNVEVQADETWMLPEGGQIRSTVGSHGYVERCRGVYDVDYALSAESQIPMYCINIDTTPLGNLKGPVVIGTPCPLILKFRGKKNQKVWKKNNFETS
jgi:hypothetical protein